MKAASEKGDESCYFSGRCQSRAWSAVINKSEINVGKKLTVVLYFVVVALILAAGYMLVGNPFNTATTAVATEPNDEKPFEMPKPVKEFEVVAPNGQKFKAQVFDLPSDKPKEPPQKKERVSAFGTKDGRLLQADLVDSEILIGDSEARIIDQTIKVLQKDIFRLEFSIEGTMIASMNSNNLVLWDIKSGKETLKIEGSFEKDETIAFSEEKGKIGVLKFSEDRKASVRRWDIKTGEHLKDE